MNFPKLKLIKSTPFFNTYISAMFIALLKKEQ